MRGFTLIEAVIYLALFSILMTGCVMSLYSIENSSRSRAQATTLSEEATFIEAKIDWAVRQAAKVDEPRAGEGSELMLETPYGKIVFATDSGVLDIQMGSADALPLTSQNVTVDQFLVTPIIENSEVIGVDTAFTLSGEPFELRSYLLP